MSYSSLALSATSTATDEDQSVILSSSSEFTIIDKHKEQTITAVNLALWIFESFLMGTNVLLTEDHRFYLKFFIPNMCLMMVTCIILYQGLKGQKWWMLVPWICASFYMMHAHHIRDVISIYSRLRTTPDVCNTAWLMWSTYFVVTCYHIQLMVKTIGIALQQWYTTKLLHDLEESIAEAVLAEKECNVDPYDFSDIDDDVPVIELPEIDMSDTEEQFSETPDTEPVCVDARTRRSQLSIASRQELLAH